MGELIPTGLDAPVRLARLLQSGVHVGMLADQHYSKGVEVTFFGRRCLANPLIAMLARQTELPIYGMRVVRKADGNSFWGEISGAGATGPRRRRSDRSQRHHAGRHIRHRRLDPPVSRTMAVAPSALALAVPGRAESCCSA